MSLEIVSKIERIGGSISLEGDRLKVCIPENCPEAEALVQELRAQKQEVLRELRERRQQDLAPCGSPDCAGCYEVEPGRRIHPPKPSAEWLDWLKRWEPKGVSQSTPSSSRKRVLIAGQLVEARILATAINSCTRTRSSDDRGGSYNDSRRNRAGPALTGV